LRLVADIQGEDLVQKSWWSPILGIVKHSSVNSTGFVCVALSAICSFYAVRVVEHIGASGFVVYVLTGVEYATVSIDSAYLIGSLVVSAWRRLKEDLHK
jgi:hypothetical protein